MFKQVGKNERSNKSIAISRMVTIKTVITAPPLLFCWGWIEGPQARSFTLLKCCQGALNSH